LGEWILRTVFGEGFEPGFRPLLVLLVGQLFNTATGALYPMLKMIGEEKPFARVSFLGSVTNVALCFLFVPTHGAMGAAFGTAASLALVNVVLGIYAIRKLQINPLPHWA
jgi:O-antigen/teichoic acid export membrane protein